MFILEKIEYVMTFIFLITFNRLRLKTIFTEQMFFKIFLKIKM